MQRTSKISTKVFLFQRVKKKTRFFGQETYPVQIRFTAANKSIYLKSFFFELLKQEKFQEEYMGQPIPVEQVIQMEEALLHYLMGTDIASLSLQELRARYQEAAFDLLGALDASFKSFLVSFFQEEHLPAYASFIKNASELHTGGYLMAGMTGALHDKVLEKLLLAAAASGPPYLPFLQFFATTLQEPIPVFPAYRWQQPRIVAAFSSFVAREFPAYDPAAAIAAIDLLQPVHGPGSVHPAGDILP